MSLVQKLQVALGLTFVLATAGVISATAQTQGVADSSKPAVATNAESNPKKSEAVPPSITTSENTSEPLSAITRDSDGSKKDAVVKDAVVKDAVVNSSTAPTAPSQTAPEDKWNFVFSPYFWMAGLHGTTGGPNRTIQVDERFSELFDSLKFAFMGVFEAHKGNWAMQTDVEYVSIEDDKATPGPLFSSANAKVKTFVFTPEVGYKFYNDPDKGTFVQVLGGTRIWHISTDLTFNAGVLPAVRINDSRNWVDAVVGMRGKVALSEKFFFLGRFDLGGGGSKFTYQLFGGLGYNFNKRVAFVVGYRDLDVNYDKNNFLFDMSQRGPIMGVGFKF
jgi:hypothetical protein